MNKLNKLQKTTIALIALFGLGFIDGFLGLGFSETFYTATGVGVAITLFFLWRCAFPKK